MTLTPTWTATVPALIGILRNHKADETSQKMAMEQLMRLAQAVDSANSQNGNGK